MLHLQFSCTSSPLDSHSGQRKPAGSTWQLACIFERPTRPILMYQQARWTIYWKSGHIFPNFINTRPILVNRKQPLQKSLTHTHTHLQHTLIWWGQLDFDYLALLFAFRGGGEQKEEIYYKYFITLHKRLDTIYKIKEMLKYVNCAHLCNFWCGLCLIDVAQHVRPVLEVNTNLWTHNLSHKDFVYSRA